MTQANNKSLKVHFYSDPGNKNAAKPDDQKAESYIHARCTSSDKAGWVKAAQSKGMKLTEWIVSVLNEATKK